MSTPITTLAAVLDAFFADLNAKEAARRAQATDKFMYWGFAGKYALRCPSGKKKGQSVLAYVGKANINTSKWSRFRFEKLTRTAKPDDLDARTANDVPDGAWIWLGCMNAAAQDSGRRPRLEAFRSELELRWGEEKLLAGIIALRDQLPHLEKPVARAFERAWRQEWDGRVKGNGLVRETSASVFVRRWNEAAANDPVPTLSLAKADHLAHALIKNPGFWLDSPDALRAASAILSHVHAEEPIGLGSELDLAFGAVEAYRFPDRPIQARHIAGWASINPVIAERLASQGARHLAAELPDHTVRTGPRSRL